jgi:signal transduction histidine kinase
MFKIFLRIRSHDRDAHLESSEGIAALSKAEELLNSNFVGKIIEIWRENDEIISSEEYKDIVEEQYLLQVEIGWNVIIQATKFSAYIFIPMTLVNSWNDLSGAVHFALTRAFIILLTIFIYQLGRSKYKITFLHHNFMLLGWLLLSVFNLWEQCKIENPEPYDPWIVHWLVSFWITIIYCLKWRRLVIWYSIHRLMYFTTMWWNFGDKMKHYNIAYQFGSIIFYAFICIVLCKVILNGLIIFHKNKKLADAIKNILQIFPEAVIIRSEKRGQDIDPEIVFWNNQASWDFLDHKDISVQKISEKEESEETQLLLMEILDEREIHLSKYNFFDEDEWEKIMIIPPGSQLNTSNDPQFYTIRTIEVNWIDSSKTYMHVFINTTNIHRLEKAKATNKCMQIMFSSISHELRTPINAFMNANEMIDFSVDNIIKWVEENQQCKCTSLINKMTSIIKKNTHIASVSSNLLLNLTEDILDFAKIEAGIFALCHKPFEIHQFLQDIRSIFEDEWKAKGLGFNIEWDEQIEYSTFLSDVGRIKQIVINLISNSFKFTNNGFIKLTIESIIGHSFDRNKKFLRITVEDSGIGISIEDQNKLFQVFGMIHKYRNQFNIRGTGLGLTITQKLVKLLGGEISLESVEEKGTSVTFTVQEHESDDKNKQIIQISNGLSVFSDKDIDEGRRWDKDPLIIRNMNQEENNPFFH